MPAPGFFPCGVWPARVAMKTGSCATDTYEPREARKGAAVSRIFRVPQGHLVGVNYGGNARKGESKVGCTAINYFVYFRETD